MTPLRWRSSSWCNPLKAIYPNGAAPAAPFFHAVRGPNLFQLLQQSIRCTFGRYVVHQDCVQWGRDTRPRMSAIHTDFRRERRLRSLRAAFGGCSPHAPAGAARRSGRQRRQTAPVGNGLRTAPRYTSPITTVPRRIRTSHTAEKLEKTAKNFLTNQPSHSILMKLFETAPNKRVAAIAQSVERILGKDEVASSNLASSSICCYSSVGRAHPW